MAKDLNCHFVSRCLTEPWEFGQKRLHFYDVKTGRFGQQSSKSLLARRGLNTQSVERRIDKLIETPLSSAIRDWSVSGQERVLAIDRWPVFRALILIFPFQVPRAVQSRLSAQECKSHPVAGKLETMCSLSDSEIDEFAELLEQRHNFRIFRTSPRFPLFFPSRGCFPIPLIDESSLQPDALAIPLTERLGVARVPKGTDDDQLEALLSSDGWEFACRLSVGTNAERVVIHPSIMGCCERDELGRYIISAQEKNRRDLRILGEMISLLFREQ